MKIIRFLRGSPNGRCERQSCTHRPSNSFSMAADGASIQDGVGRCCGENFPLNTSIGRINRALVGAIGRTLVRLPVRAGKTKQLGKRSGRMARWPTPWLRSGRGRARVPLPRAVGREDPIGRLLCEFEVGVSPKILLAGVDTKAAGKVGSSDLG